MVNIKVRLQPIVRHINLPTVIKTAILPGEALESLFIATQVGEIFNVSNNKIRTFLDLRNRIIKLGELSGGYDERGLLGLAFHPRFHFNGLFYLHYSVAGSQGPGAMEEPFTPNPCDPATLNLKWVYREKRFDHIDTIEEWILQPYNQPQRRRTILNLRRPFSNHNGVNSLNFSPETGNLVLTTGDGGSGYDPFNLSQDNMEIAGKIIEIDVDRNTYFSNPPIVSRFDELPRQLQEILSVTVKGVRNNPGITYQRLQNQYIKYVGQVGQDLVESIYSYSNEQPIPVPQLIQSYNANDELDYLPLVNFGWRWWEGTFPTMIIKNCSENASLKKKTIAYYNEAVNLSAKHIYPLTSYFHEDPRPNKFAGTALTGVQAYMGTSIPALSGSVVFTDFVQKGRGQSLIRGVLAYTRRGRAGQLSEFHMIETDYDFGNESAYFVSLGANSNQTRLFLGVYGSMRVTELNQGRVFEIVL